MKAKILLLVMGAMLLLPQNNKPEGWEIFSKVAWYPRFFEDAGELGCDCGDIRLADPAHRHALMNGLNHHRDAFRLQHTINRLGNLSRHGFLGLQAPPEHLHYTREL